MKKYIRIEIPNELKEQFESEKHELENISLGKNKTDKLKLFLANDMIVEVLDMINEVTNYSPDGYVINKGFYKEFQQWVDLNLKNLMKANRIDVSNKQKEKDIYLALHYSEFQLKENSEASLEELVENAECLINKAKKGLFYNSEIKNMCRIFLRIGLGEIIVSEVIDISYYYYLRNVIRAFGMSYEEFIKINGEIEDIFKDKLNETVKTKNKI